ncbi:MAG: hypothetical protein JSS66_06080 [Armatimonadetes bacterium]|nr:hypothetical protein [Armatimonadota bacterium]
MGTRNSTLVQVDDQYKIAQYGQWDGYPEGRGINILQLLRSVDLNVLKERVRALTDVSKGVSDTLWASYEQEFINPTGARKQQLSDMPYEQKRALQLKHPGFLLSRDCAGDGVLSMIMDDEVSTPAVSRDLTFPGDGLFCEWAYVIDFDLGTFEVYEGFSEEPLPDDARFKCLEKEDEQYKPVRKIVEWHLDSLPSDEEFLTTCNAAMRHSDDAEEESAPDEAAAGSTTTS